MERQDLKNPRMSREEGHRRLKMKSELCRRFKQRGVCFFGSKCNYAHGIAELRHFQQPIQLCILYLQNKHCPYGPNCRFLHSTSPNPEKIQSGQGHLDGSSSAEYKSMQASAAATNANASTSTMETSSLHNKNAPYSVKCMFKINKLQKISGIYADWI